MMKKIVILFALFASIVSMRAERVLVDGLFYEVLSESERTVQVVDNQLASDTLLDLVIPGKVTIDGSWYEVQKVNYPALKDCNLIKSVSIPSSLQEIEIYAFAGCENLRKVTFANCNSLVLGYGCFNGCNVETIILSGNVRYDTDSNYPYWSMEASQLVINGDIPSFYDLSAQTIIINDNVSDLGGVSSLFANHLYCLGKIPPKLGIPEASMSNTYKRTHVHVPEDAYAAYFQAPVWSSFEHLTNDAVETKKLSFSTNNKVLNVGETFELTIDHDGTIPVKSFFCNS